MTLQGKRQLDARLDAIASGRPILQTLQLRAIAESKKIAEGFHKTRNLQRGIQPGSVTDTTATIQSVAPYSRYVERGTGIYGPRKKKIVPKKGKVLAWRTGSVRLTGRSRTSKGKQTAGWAYARSVKGRKATPFLLPGAQKAARSAGVEVIVKLWNEAA